MYETDINVYQTNTGLRSETTSKHEINSDFLN